jgi:hypothetical protein
MKICASIVVVRTVDDGPARDMGLGIERERILLGAGVASDGGGRGR